MPIQKRANYHFKNKQESSQLSQVYVKPLIIIAIINNENNLINDNEEKENNRFLTFYG